MRVFDMEQLQTPAYLYNLNEIKEAVAELRNSLPDSSNIHYSLKANPHPEIVKYLMNLGCSAEISSTKELKVVRQCGGDLTNCLYTGPGKTKQELEIAIKSGLLNISIESQEELKILQNLTEELDTKINIILRVNPNTNTNGKGLVMAGTSTQFGFDEEQLKLVVKSINSGLIEIIGFHIYTGSNINNSKMLFHNFRTCLETAMKLKEELNINLKYLNLGGGFSHPYANNESRPKFEGLKEKLEYLFQAYDCIKSKEVNVYFESGRYLVGSCGKLLTTVQSVKESKGKGYVVLDSGINHLGGMSGLNRIPKVKLDFIKIDYKDADNNIQSGTAVKKYDIVGPLCTPIDILARGIEIANIKAGDKFLINNVGAYGLTASLMGFLSRDLPYEVIIEDELVKKITTIEMKTKILQGGI